MTSKTMNVLRAMAPALLLALPATAAENPQIAVEEVTLDNGMTWLLYENHDSPTVFAGWVARVGSVNERPGMTGISHFFEHMMFKGTHTIGTTDIEADLKAAYVGMLELPKDARFAVHLAYTYYRRLLRRIMRHDSKSILESRVRIPDTQKLLLWATTYTRHRLRLA